MFDAGQAAAFMQLAAWELGIGSCPASIYEPKKREPSSAFRKNFICGLHYRSVILSMKGS